MKYEIKGDTLPVVLCYLEGGEKMINEGGSMSWMSPNMKMETTTNGVSLQKPTRMRWGCTLSAATANTTVRVITAKNLRFKAL